MSQVFAPHLKAHHRHHGILRSSLAASSPSHHSYAINVPQVDSVSVGKHFHPARAIGQTGRSALGMSSNTEYTIEVYLGSPPQKMILELDTGSNLLWFHSTSMPKAQSGNHKLFDPAKSTSYRATGGDYSILYDDNSSSKGSVGQDHLQLGGVQISTANIGLAKAASGSFPKEAADGLIGLSPDSTILQDMYNGKVLKGNVFTLRLSGDGHSDITFGEVDTTYASSPVKYVPIAQGPIKQWRAQNLGIRSQRGPRSTIKERDRVL